MRVFIIFSFVFLHLFFIPLQSADEISNQDIIEVYQDEIFVEENIKLSQAMSDGINAIAFQNYQQSQIAEVTEKYLTTEMSNEELWEVLDSIYEEADTYSESLDTTVQSFSIKSSSSNLLAQSIYNKALELLYEINEFSIQNNKVTKNLIDHLSEGDIDKYDYLTARSYFSSADFLEILSKNNLAQANRILSDLSLGKWVLIVDAEVIDFISVATRVNAHEMIGELNKAKLKEYEYALESKYKKIKKRSSYKNLINSIDNLKNIIKDISDLDEDYTEEIEIINNLIINGKLYTDANIRNAEIWYEILKFYEDNINNIDVIYTDSTLSATFGDIQRRQVFIQQEVIRYSNEYEKATAEFTRIANRLLSL